MKVVPYKVHHRLALDGFFARAEEEGGHSHSEFGGCIKRTKKVFPFLHDRWFACSLMYLTGLVLGPLRQIWCEDGDSGCGRLFAFGWIHNLMSVGPLVGGSYREACLTVFSLRQIGVPLAQYFLLKINYCYYFH